MEVLTQERQDLTAQYSTEINIVAQFLAQGLNPLLLDEQGQHEDAQSLRFVIGILTENEILGQAHKQAKELRQQEIDRSTKEKEINESPTPSRTKPPRQTNFYHLLSPRRGKQEKSSESQGNDLEITIDKWHKAFDSPRNNKLRNDILGYEARREWAQLKKELGLTQKAKTEKLRRQAAIAIERLKDAGVIDKLFQQLGQKDREKLIIQLEKFDLSQKEPWVDPYSSDGFTIYPSKESYISHLDNN